MDRTAPSERGNVGQGRSFRLACHGRQGSHVLDLLRMQGFAPRIEPFSGLAATVPHEPLPLGSSIAARFGLIYIQDRSSMLAPLALAPKPGERVLDMCASPGGKSGFVAMLVGGKGLVLANEPSRDRLATMRANFRRQNLLQCVTCSCPGQDLPLPDASFSAILLDPPCSGWGVADKHPQVRRLWTGDKVEALVRLQRELLAEAARILAPGGRVIYSTCTTNPAENEEQILWAIRELGLVCEPLEPPPGLAFSPPAIPGLDGVLRVDEQAHGDQGHFVARLCRKGTPQDRSEEQGIPLGGEHLTREDLPPGRWNTALLDEGDLVRFGENVYYVPRQASHLDRKHFRWQGTAVGRTGRKGIRLSPEIRALMPAFDEQDSLDLASLAGVQGYSSEQGADMFGDLAAGRSVRISQDMARGLRQINLYYKSLPLALLGVKNGRLLLPRG